MAVSFLGSLGQSFTIIFLSELADRTFILVLIYASKLSWMPLLLTGLLSMGLMNILAISIGYLVPLILVKDVIDWIGFFCFLIFGILSINESLNMEQITLHDEMLDLDSFIYKISGYFFKNDLQFEFVTFDPNKNVANYDEILENSLSL